LIYLLLSASNDQNGHKHLTLLIFEIWWNI